MTFNNVASLLSFTEAYNGWRFEGADGKMHVALVEFAPSQKFISADKKLDPIAGKYSTASQYLEFVTAMAIPDVAEPKAYPSSAPAKADVAMTPLLLYLAERKTKKKINNKSTKVNKNPAQQRTDSISQSEGATKQSSTKSGKKKRKPKKAKAKVDQGVAPSNVATKKSIMRPSV